MGRGDTCAVRTIEAVLFDLDDTLLDAGAAWRSGVDELVAARCPGTDPERAVLAWAAAFPEWFEAYLIGRISLEASRAGRIRDWAGALGVEVPQGQEQRWFDSYVTGYQRGWAPFPEVSAALAWLAASSGLPLGIVTNGDSVQQRQKVAALGLDGLVGVVVASADLGVPKPDAAPFRHAAEALGVDPAACLMVGDRLEIDVVGALAAGMQAVWLRRPVSAEAHPEPPPELAGRYRTIESLTELPGLLGMPGASGCAGTAPQDLDPVAAGAPGSAFGDASTPRAPAQPRTPVLTRPAVDPRDG